MNNILHIVCHDLGKHLGCYGALVESPNLDRLAAGGIRFDRAFCSSPACTPSRNCAMTGRYAHVSGGIGLAHMGWPLPASENTIVDDSNAADWETAHFGLNHERHARENRYQVDGERQWEDWRVENAVDAFITWLGKRDRSRPFYCNIGTAEAHGSAFMNDARLAEYGGAIPDPAVYLPPWLPENPHVRRVLGRFQAAIRHLDTHMGRLLRACEAAGLLDDTLIVFTTDHGIADPARRAKGTLYDRGCEVALLAHPPRGCPTGFAVSHLIPNIDLRPTFCEAGGFSPTSKPDGRSFWPLLQGHRYAPNRRLFTERNFHGEPKAKGSDVHVDCFDPVRAVRDDRWHYLRWFEPAAKTKPWSPLELIGGPPVTWSGQFNDDLPVSSPIRAAEELYDTLADPLELIDLAQRPECAAIKTGLRADMDAWMSATNDFVLRGEIPKRYTEPGWGNWPA